MFKGTTILAIRHQGMTVMAGDGQVTMQERTVMKHRAQKVRELYKGQVLAGFAGAVADAMTLFEKFEGYLEERRGNLTRAAVDVAKEWRTDRILRKLEALLIVADTSNILLLSGSGEVIEPDEPVIAVGSGGNYAQAAAQALRAHTDLSARVIAQEAMKVAASLCVYTNEQLTIKELRSEEGNGQRG